MGMGTGKSKVVVDLIGNDETIRRALILCPKSVIDVWPRQFEIHGVRDIRVIARRKETTKQFRKLLESAREPFVAVLNYEGARYGTDTETCKLKRKEAEPGSLAEWIFAQSWDLVVLDESHRVKDPTGTTGKFASKLRARARKRLCLTGTPMPHSPLDAFSQFRFLDPSIFGDSWTRFRARYAIMGGFRGADGVPKQVIGFQNQNEMAAKMEPLTFTARTEDVLDLPPFVNVDRKFDLGVEERRVYRQLEGALIADVKSGVVTAANALVKLLRLQQVSCGYGRIDDAGAGTNGACARYEQLGTSRRDLLEEVLEGIEPEEPVAVFCRFTPDLAAVRSVAESLGREYVELSGQRNDLRGGVWTTGNVIGVQIQAGGLGVDLTRARHCVYYSLGFSLGDYEQSRARVRRPGQTRAVSYVHLIGRDTVDQQIYEALLAKREVVEYLLAQL
jgi:SNF2 family DNA or RNA helicase